MPPNFSHLASGFHRCWPLRPWTRDLFALMQVRGTCDASSGGSGMGARDRVVAGSADAVPSDGCGLSDLLDPLYATGEQDREALCMRLGSRTGRPSILPRAGRARGSPGGRRASPLCPARSVRWGEFPCQRAVRCGGSRGAPVSGTVRAWRRWSQPGGCTGSRASPSSGCCWRWTSSGLVDLLAQPMALKFTRSSGGTSEHVPDLLAVTRDGVLLIDVRPAPDRAR